MGRSRQEHQLIEALSAQRLAGRREGQTAARNATYERILKTVVAGIIAKEVADVLTVVSSSGPVAALTALESLSVVEWPARWAATLAPILGSIAEDVTTERRAKLIEANPAVGERFPIISQVSDDYLENVGKAAETSKDKISVILERNRNASVDVVAAKIREAELEMVNARSEFIAADQLLKVSKSTANRQAVESGVVATKTRRDSNDSRVRDTHERWDGETVAIGATYSSGETYPGELEWSCRCSERFYLKPEFLGGGSK